MPGYYAASQSTPECLACPPGQINIGTGLSTCTNCPVGRFQNVSGLTFCPTCTAGNYSASAGSPLCMTCAPGLISAEAGATMCKLCEPGTFSKTWGATACETCKTMPLYWTSGLSFCPDTVSGPLAGRDYDGGGVLERLWSLVSSTLWPSSRVLTSEELQKRRWRHAMTGGGDEAALLRWVQRTLARLIRVPPAAWWAAVAAGAVGLAVLRCIM